MLSQIVAITIFIGMFLMIIVSKFERHIVTLSSALLVIVVVCGICMHSTKAMLTILNVKSVFSTGFWYGTSESGNTGINWATIIFVASMMIMVEGLGEAGFFRWVCLLLAKLVHYHIIPLFISFMCMAAALSMFIDSITVVLFLAAVTVELARTLKFDPVPMILSEVFCANLGGSSTMCGDPPNIIIGTSLGYTFSDFIANTGLIIAICFVCTLVYFWLCFRKGLKKSEINRGKDVTCPAPSSAIVSKKAFVGAVFVFLTAVILLVTHAYSGLTVAFIGVIVTALTILNTLLTAGTSKVKMIISRIDYKTLLFFIGLFVSVGGLEQTGVLALLAKFIMLVSGGKLILIIAIILWLSAIASAFIDNIPFAATMVPVIKTLAAAQGIDLSVLAWTLSIGTDIGGNATPIGASANVVGTSVAAKEGHPVSWGTYCRYCVPATIIVVSISMVCLVIRYL